MSKSKDAAAEKAVYDYLNKQNRPYSAIDIFNNLHKEHGKTVVVKVLDGLVQSKKIKSKVYGKQTVYVADQSQFPDVPEKVLRDLDTEIQSVSAHVKQTAEEVKQLEAELRSLTSSMTTAEAKSRLSEVVAKCEKFQAKLKELKANKNAVSPEERQQIVKDRTTFVKEWRKRKRIGNDILEAILEGYPKSKKALCEEVGVETDEDYNVKPPDV